MLWKTWEKAGWMTTLVHYYLIYSRIKTCQAWPNIFNQLPCVSFLPRCTSDAIAGPSHTAGHEDTVPAQTTARGASTDYKDPPRMSPPVFSGSAHDGGCIFVPTPGMPTPPLAHVEPTMPTSSLTPYEKAIQIEHILAEDIEPVVGLRRSRRPPTHAPNCGIGDGMYFVYTSHLLELLILCIWLNMLI